MPRSLPIDDAIPALLEGLGHWRAAVVVAPPGSGKTTRIPPALLDAGVGGGGRVVLLQPRRVAARMAARWIARSRGGQVGGEVGFQVRFERAVSPQTRLEVLTEGLLTRRLQEDPFLSDTGCVVLDEFHERSLHADLGLALLREVQQDAREDLKDLKIVIMSATLDPDPLVEWFGGPEVCGVIRTESRLHPVKVDYLDRPAEGRTGPRCAAGVRRGLARSDAGHVLAFLPGVREIREAAAALSSVPVPVLPLHGRLSGREQDRALAPSAGRKVVLATNIAETSVTLEGVRVVVDTGLAREPRFDPSMGLERLETHPIPLDSVEQRTGRAGRTGPGLALRLWTRQEQRARPASRVPEVARADLAAPVLELRAWGVDPRRFRWFEAPPSAHLARAESLLEELGAISGGVITEVGRRLVRFPVHPRLGRVLLAGVEQGAPRDAALLAALASEPDPFFEDPPEGTEDDDLGWRMEAVRAFCEGRPVDRGFSRGRMRNLVRAWNQLTRLAKAGRRADPAVLDSAQRTAVLRAGFPDRVAVRRRGSRHRYRLVGGRGARLAPHSAAQGVDLLLAVGLEGARPGRHREQRVRVAAPVAREALPTHENREVRFDETSESVQAERILRYRDLVLERVPAPDAPDPAAAARCLEAAARARPHRALVPTAPLAALLGRLRFLAVWMPDREYPGFWNPADLLPSLCVGHTRLAELRELDLAAEIRGRLDWRVRKELDRLAPERIRVPSGASIRVQYGLDVRQLTAELAPGATPWTPQRARAPDSPYRRPPVLAARIQQLFGMEQTPRIAGGRVGLVIHLLAPNGRPAQITTDLQSFWSEGYAAVRKELRGRYPRHAWPEHPGPEHAENHPRRRR